MRAAECGSDERPKIVSSSEPGALVTKIKR